MRKWRYVILVWVFQVSVTQGEPVGQALYPPLPDDVTPQLSERGKWQVGVTTLSITNTAQPADLQGNKADRELQVEVWYPTAVSATPTHYHNETRSGIPFDIAARAYRDVPVAEATERFPLVVLSHGYTGYRTIMFYLGEHLASHGYIVAGIDHTDSTNADVDMAQAPYSGFPSTLLNRARDQNFTLDAILRHERFADFADQQRAGLIGYSMGGFGAVNTVGGCFEFGSAAVSSFTGLTDPDQIAAVQAQLNTCSGGQEAVDHRWKAMIALAPWGGQHQVFSPAALAAISVPTLYVAGDQDDISGYQGIRWLYENTSATDARLLTIHNARHNIAPHPAPREAFSNELDLGHYYEPAWRSQSLNNIIAHFSLAMMDCYVRGQSEACEFLAVSGRSDQAAVEGEMPPPWKGFDHRYALGMSMESGSK